MRKAFEVYRFGCWMDGHSYRDEKDCQSLAGSARGNSLVTVTVGIHLSQPHGMEKPWPGPGAVLYGGTKKDRYTKSIKEEN